MQVKFEFPGQTLVAVVDGAPGVTYTGEMPLVSCSHVSLAGDHGQSIRVSAKYHGYTCQITLNGQPYAVFQNHIEVSGTTLDFLEEGAQAPIIYEGATPVAVQEPSPIPNHEAPSDPQTETSPTLEQDD